MEKATTDGKQQVHLLLEKDILKRIDDFRFKHRFATRAAAIKWLLEWSLDQKPKVEQNA